MNTYKFVESDLKSVLNFVKNYHLEPTKGLRGRTNQGKRGFGGELDEWVPGKLVEIGVCRILEKISGKKKLKPDFKIYTNKEVTDRKDPDITEVSDTSVSVQRKYRVFVEIKKEDRKDRWLGSRKHQLKNLKEKELDEGYMIHASIEFVDNAGKKKKDIVASILKKIISSDLIDLSEFSDFKDLVVEVKYAYSFRDLLREGHFFESGNIIPEIEFPKSRSAFKKDGILSSVYEIRKRYSGEVTLDMKWENHNRDLSFSEWKISGEFLILKDKRNKEYIHAINSVQMRSKVFGLYDLCDNTTYRFFYKNTLGKQEGKDNFKKIDDWWFSKKRLDELLLSGEINDTLVCLKNIADAI